MGGKKGSPIRNTAATGLRGACMTILQDGEWHTFTEIFYQVEKLVRPEVAMRTFQGRRPDSDLVLVPLSEQIEGGKQKEVTEALSDMGLEFSGVRGMRKTYRYRLRPEHLSNNTFKIEYGAAAVRALATISVIAAQLKFLNEELERNEEALNPTQAFWVRKAVEPPPGIDSIEVDQAEEVTSA